MLFGFALSGSVGNAEFLKDQLRQQNVYRWGVEEVAPSLLYESVAEATPPEALARLSQTELADRVATEITPLWAQEQTEQAIDQALPYLLGRSDSLSITIDLRDRKTALIDAILALLGFPAGAGSQAREEMREELDVRIPGRISLTAANVPAEWQSIRGVLGGYLGFLQTGAAILAGVCLLIALVGGRSVRGKLRWGAASLALGAAFAWGASQVALAILPALFGDAVASADMLSSPAISEKLAEVAESLVRGMLDLYAVQALLFLAGAVAIFVVSLLPLPSG